MRALFKVCVRVFLAYLLSRTLVSKLLSLKMAAGGVDYLVHVHLVLISSIPACGASAGAIRVQPNRERETESPIHLIKKV